MTELTDQETGGECPLCGGTGETLKALKRTMGYTFGLEEAQSLDESIIPCPLCSVGER